MKGRETDISFLCLPPEVEAHWEAYCAQYAVDGTEHSFRELARFLIEARKRGTEVQGNHMDIALPLEYWPSATIEAFADAVEAIQTTLDVSEENYGMKWD